MNRVKLASATFAIALTVIGVMYASTQVRRQDAAPTGVTKGQTPTLSAEKVVTTQQRLNRYFHSAVMPKLPKCWMGIQGKGQIEVEHNYSKGSDGRWVSGNITVMGSNLPKGQDLVALRCLQDASRGTSFAAQPDETTSKYVARWTWPVPFPSNAAQLTTNMFAARVNNSGGDSGGCDGKGAQPKCLVCETSKQCKRVCVGYNECTVTSYGVCGQTGSCASGGPFGVAGQTVIY